MELVKINGSASYFSGPTNIGVIHCGNGEAIVIDTGIDQQVAKKLLKALEGEGLAPRAVINTHSHADHTGGNALLQSRCGVPVYASTGEAPFIENPVLEPSYLLGGAAPWKEMRNKFLCAPPSKVTPLNGEQSFTVGEAELAIHVLPGHSFDQIGVSYDGILFSGDAFLAPEYLQKHGIPYNVDIQGYLQSLDSVLSTGALWTVPGHGIALEDPSGVLEENRKTVLDQVAAVLELVRKPSTLEEVLRRLAEGIGLTIGSPPLFFLYRTAVTAYLSFLHGKGEVVYYLEDNQLYWLRK